MVSWKGRSLAFGTAAWFLFSAFYFAKLACIVCAIAIVFSVAWEQIDEWRQTLTFRNLLNKKQLRYCVLCKGMCDQRIRECDCAPECHSSYKYSPLFFVPGAR